MVISPRYLEKQLHEQFTQHLTGLLRSSVSEGTRPIGDFRFCTRLDDSFTISY
jgi:hypothetical protein